MCQKYNEISAVLSCAYKNEKPNKACFLSCALIQHVSWMQFSGFVFDNRLSCAFLHTLFKGRLCMFQGLWQQDPKPF